jgi:hypothetical protein
MSCAREARPDAPAWCALALVLLCLGAVLALPIAAHRGAEIVVIVDTGDQP